MNCYNHPTQTVVAQCVDCSKGLCYSCARIYSIPICNFCNGVRIKNERNRIIKEFSITFIIGISLAYLFGQLTVYNDGYSHSLKHDVYFYLIYTYIFAGTVAGWQTLTKITPRTFLILPIIGWLVYFAIKLFLSFWLGLVMLPIRTIKNIIRLVQLQKTPT